jgi:hypothetical protein
MECAGWISARMKAVGLSAGSKGYLQDFEVASTPGTAADRPWVDEDRPTRSPRSSARGREVEGEPVWCGYGVEDAEHG